jgi:hypothetical protein
MTASIRLKIAVFAPMPSIIEINAIRVVPGFLARDLAAKRMSLKVVSTE